MLLRILRASISPRFLIVAISLLAGYTVAYFGDRTLRRMPNGAVQVECGSRLSAALFAPATRLESSWRSREYVDADQRLVTAVADAKATNRKILLTIGAEHCLPCRQLEQLLEEQRDLLAKHFVVVKLNCDGETFHGRQVQDRYRTVIASKGEYYPWVATLDEDGNVLVTGDDGPAKVIGLAHGGPSDRAWFLAMLQKSAPRMTEGDLGKFDRAATEFHNRIWENIGGSKSQRKN